MNKGASFVHFHIFQTLHLSVMAIEVIPRGEFWIDKSQ
jgi:hypothetical protein